MRPPCLAELQPISLGLTQKTHAKNSGIQDESTCFHASHNPDLSVVKVPYLTISKAVRVRAGLLR
jgi:hypothetical protein